MATGQRKGNNMKPKITNKKKHDYITCQMTYEYQDKLVKRNVVILDGKFRQCDGFITSGELDIIKQIIEEYF